MIALLLAAPLLLTEKSLSMRARCAPVPALLQQGAQPGDAPLEKAARACGFSSATQFLALGVRMRVANCELTDAAMLSKFTPAKKAQLEAQVAAERDPQQKEALQRSLERIESAAAQAEARRRRPHESRLNLRACSDNAPQSKTMAKLLDQPALSEAERAAFSSWQREAR